MRKAIARIEDAVTIFLSGAALLAFGSVVLASCGS
jgi:hypothetical protein